MPRFLKFVAFCSLVIAAMNLIILLFVAASQMPPPTGGGVPTLYIGVAALAVVAALASTVFLRRRSLGVRLPVKRKATRGERRMKVTVFKKSRGSWLGERMFTYPMRRKYCSEIEEAIPILFERYGFSVRRGAQFLGRSGATHDIDFLFVKGRQTYAVEIKNFTLASPDVDDFVVKILDIPKDRYHALPVIVSRGFTEKAAKAAKKEGVKLFDAKSFGALEQLIQHESRLDYQ